MAAIFYTYSGNDIFQVVKGDGSALISIEQLDQLTDNAGFLSIITNVNVQTAEITQFFPTFDNIIHYQYFGKGIGSIAVDGILFSSCDGTIPGLSQLYSTIQGMRGKQVTVSMAGIAFTAVITGSSCTLMGEPDTMAQFQLSMQIIADSMGGGN